MSADFDISPQDRSSQTATSTGYFIALYLILLSFFIMLTAISQINEQRLDAARETVRTTFDNPEPQDQDEVDADQPPQVTSFFAGIQQSFLAELGVTGRFPGEHGNILEVAVPSEYLFAPGQSAVRPDRYRFLSQLVDLLSAAPSGYHFEVLLLTGLGSEQQGPTLLPEQAFAAKRSANLAVFMEGVGLPNGLYATGFIPYNDDEIIAVFRANRIGDRPTPWRSWQRGIEARRGAL